MKISKVLSIMIVLIFAFSASLQSGCPIDFSGMDICVNTIEECEEAPSGYCVVSVCQAPVPDGVGVPCKL